MKRKRTPLLSVATLPPWATTAPTGRQEQVAEAAPIEVTGEPMPWRRKLARWPDPYRERWGLLANALEETGLGWREAEERAFNEVRRERTQTEGERSD